MQNMQTNQQKETKKQALDPKCPWKMKVLNPQYMGEITPI